jgi:hypothetical protein
MNLSIRAFVGDVAVHVQHQITVAAGVRPRETQVKPARLPVYFAGMTVPSAHAVVVKTIG